MHITYSMKLIIFWLISTNSPYSMQHMGIVTSAVRFTSKSDRHLPCSYIVDVFDLFQGVLSSTIASGDKSITIVCCYINMFLLNTRSLDLFTDRQSPLQNHNPRAALMLHCRHAYKQTPNWRRTDAQALQLGRPKGDGK